MSRGGYGYVQIALPPDLGRASHFEMNYSIGYLIVQIQASIVTKGNTWSTLFQTLLGTKTVSPGARKISFDLPFWTDSILTLICIGLPSGCMRRTLMSLPLAYLLK